MTTIDEQNAEYRKKYWKPEWSSLSQDEKLKDPEFVKYLYGLIKVGLDYLKEQKAKGAAPEAREFIDNMIESYEQMLKSFVIEEENK